MPSNLSRRRFLTSCSVAGLSAAVGSRIVAEPVRRPRVAAIFSTFFFRSHAFNILENFFRPYLFNGKLVDPGVDVVSFYGDQFAKGDMAREVSQRLNVPLCPTIADALTLGTGSMAVDAVLSIVEQGDYPANSRGVVMYPRKEFFDQAVSVMRRTNQFVPFFNDKHLSYRWDWSKEMFDTAQCFGIPLMAGSSVPLAQRTPLLELPANADIDEAVAIHGGGPESYDFHGLELLQSFVESRRGGESGIAAVEFLEGESLKNAANAGRWSLDLADAALQAEVNSAHGNLPRGLSKSVAAIPKTSEASHGVLLTYRDGLRATVLKVGASANRWDFACRLKRDSKIHATSLFNGPWGNRNLFKALSHSVQHFFRERQSPYPVERTLLVSGVLDAAMCSREFNGQRIETPNLHLCYQPRNFQAFRETGASWRVLSNDTPEEKTFDPGDAELVR